MRMRMRMRTEAFSPSVLTMGLAVVLLVLTMSVQGTRGENTAQPDLNTISYDRAESSPSATTLGYTAEITFTPTFTDYLPVVFRDFPEYDLQLGKICAYDNQCLSGYCNDEDYVCCDTDCSGVCEACVSSKTGGVDGVCALVVSGTDPDSECSPYFCDSGGCQNTCLDDTDCQAGYYCNGLSQCVPLEVNGTPCSVNSECLSGYCVDDVCCNTVCSGVCEACVSSKTGGVDGICGYIAAGTDPDNECGSGTCDGAGGCQNP